MTAVEGGSPVAAPANEAVTAVYEPGSVNKLVTIAGALEEGLIKPGDHPLVLIDSAASPAPTPAPTPTPPPRPTWRQWYDYFFG